MPYPRAFLVGAPRGLDRPLEIGSHRLNFFYTSQQSKRI